MKHLLIILALFLVSCSFEQDTRLICDCDYVQENYQKFQCYSEAYDVDNNSLIFNESKKKFVWNGFELSIYPDQFMEFTKDSIAYRFETESEKTYNRLDRTNLVYFESKVRLDKIVDDRPVWKPSKNTYYQCRVVEGV
tara:strand:+ start:94 stop:507 length:414 start_codon:yes stop_codon:yes gene_type:complete